MPTATQILREGTRVRHLALERASLARDLMSAQLTVPRYVEILDIWSSAWAALEQRIWESPLAFEVAALLPPRRAHLVQDDFLFWHQQGYPAPRPAARLHCLIAALRPAQIPGLLGVCYVARGASVGSQVISAHLKKVLSLSHDQGMSFFAHEGEKSLTWPQWSKGLDACLSEPEALAQAVVWADATFVALQDAFSGTPSNSVVSA